MKNIRIRHKYMDNKFEIVSKINAKLIEYGIEITLVEYDDNGVYRTTERARDSRLDCLGGHG